MATDGDYSRWYRIVPQSGLFKAKMQQRPEILMTPDNRYIVVRGRLWRASNPGLSSTERTALVNALMSSRRAVGAARKLGDRAADYRAHAAVQAAKVSLEERGPVWWTDGAPDLNRHMARTTPYADWFEVVDDEPEPNGGDGIAVDR